jgi:hypothetical protein
VGFFLVFEVDISKHFGLYYLIIWLIIWFVVGFFQPSLTWFGIDVRLRVSFICIRWIWNSSSLYYSSFLMEQVEDSVVSFGMVLSTLQ